MNANDGKFTAPVDGIYYFYSQARSSGDKYATIYFYMNGSEKSYAYRDEDGENDTVTLSSQFKLNKGDTVCVRFEGTFYYPDQPDRTFFEGHLISKINT